MSETVLYWIIILLICVNFILGHQLKQFVKLIDKMNDEYMKLSFSILGMKTKIDLEEMLKNGIDENEID